jgi:hypothetical protein
MGAAALLCELTESALQPPTAPQRTAASQALNAIRFI